MTTLTILVVEGNPVTREMLRIALKGEGYAVLEARDATGALTILQAQRPNAILQDVGLLDVDGIELARRMRDTPNGRDVPIIALSERLEGLDEDEAFDGVFTAFIAKPVEPAQVVTVIAEVLVGSRGPGGRSGRGRALLIADDDPVQRKLLALQLESLGFRVEAVASGEALLRAARAEPPDGIVTDLVMPGMDGLDVCREVRRDRALASVPLVLVSAHVAEDLDPDLARAVGANGLVSRSTERDALSEQILAALDAPAPAPAPAPCDGTAAGGRDAAPAIRGLRAQAIKDAERSEVNAAQSAQLAILGAVANALTDESDFDAALEATLASCLDAASLARGAIYLSDGGEAVTLRYSVGLGAGNGAANFFGHPELLAHVMKTGEVLDLPSREGDHQASHGVLASADAAVGLLSPIASSGGAVGVVFLGSTDPALATNSLAAFGQILGAQLGQALALRRTHEKLAASERAHRAFAESASDAMITGDAAGAIVTWNPGAERLFGYPVREAIGKPLTMLMPERFRGAHADGLKRVVRGEGSPRLGGSPVELAALRNDGTEVPVEISISSWRSTDGVHFGAIIRDITARKQQMLLREQLNQSQKLESLGRLAGGVAHDFNNLLTVISSFAGFARETMPEGEQRRDDLDQVLRAADRAATLTRQLLAFSRRQPIEPRVVDLSELIGDVEKMLRRTLGEDIELSTRSAGVSPVLIDPSQFEQIILNLAINARDAMPGGGKLTIETRTAETPDEHLGDCVIMSVSDTGEGMSADVREKIFEPFFTTKAEGKGTGLGLATVFGLVEQAGGAISVASQRGEGACFEIRLPLADAPDADTADAQPRDDNLAGSEMILVVEDDALVRRAAARMLEKHGYRVISAADPVEASREFDVYQDEIALLLTDVVMPYQSGPELAAKLKEMRPNLKVLFMSGYTDARVRPDGVASSSSSSSPSPEPDSDLEFLQKPITERRLVARVRSLLDASEP